MKRDNIILYITGSPCRKGEGFFTNEGGFCDDVKLSISKVCPNGVPAILFISAAPDDDGYNHAVFSSMRECLDNSGIKYRYCTMLKRDNCEQLAELIAKSEVIILCGGHVPTQNRFLHEIQLKELLHSPSLSPKVVIGCSAGSMNCADDVYSHPELQGEAEDPNYTKNLKGLALTDINIVPHLDDIEYMFLDGKRLMDDIIVPDSINRKLYVIPDGTYIKVSKGCSSIHGECYLLYNGEVTKLSNEYGRRICKDYFDYSYKLTNIYTPMNVLFFSPHFPQTYSHFCAMLKQNGVSVFGIGDTSYDDLNDELKYALTEYYRVDNMEDYNQVYRAVAFLSFKHGKMDWVESNNEYWLEQDAQIRTDFNINTGLKVDRINSVKEKSAMKEYYRIGNVPTARQIKGSEGVEAVRDFCKLTGFPTIAKPDNGVGAQDTHKFTSQEELEVFLKKEGDNIAYFVIEEFITGSIVSYDAIADSNCEPIFENMTYFPTPIMEIVNKKMPIQYWVEKEIDPALAKLGRATLKAFDLKSRFVHFEFFKLDCDRPGLGKKGDYVGLEVNVRPAGGFTPDMMNYAHSTDVYKIWADMLAFNERHTNEGEQFFCAYAGRRDIHNYAHTHEDVLNRYSGYFKKVERVPYALSSALCDQCYIANFSTREQMQEFFDFILELKED